MTMQQTEYMVEVRHHEVAVVHDQVSLIAMHGLSVTVSMSSQQRHSISTVYTSSTVVRHH